MPDVQLSDLVTILLLIALEGVLSADNAMVLAVRVLGLPKHQQNKALRYGMFSAFTMRALATALAASLISLAWVKIVGAVYLLWLPYTHFFRGEGGEGQSRIPPATPWLGLNPFWATVVSRGEVAARVRPRPGLVACGHPEMAVAGIDCRDHGRRVSLRAQARAGAR